MSSVVQLTQQANNFLETSRQERNVTYTNFANHFKNSYMDAINNIATQVTKYEAKVHVPLADRVEVYGSLSRTLRAAADRIHASKTLFARLLSYFIYLSPEERTFSHLVNRVTHLHRTAESDQISLWTGNAILLGWLPKWILNRLLEWGEGRVFEGRMENDPRALNEEARIKYCAFRVLGTTKSENESYAGEAPLFALNNISHDIQAFIDRYGNDLLEEDLASLQDAKAKISQAQRIAYYGFANKIFIALRERNITRGYFQPDVDAISEETACCVRNVCKQLEVGGSFILPGGFISQSTGHAVIFEIRRNQDDYTFTVYNSGDGVDNHQSNWQTIVGSALQRLAATRIYTVRKLDIVADVNFHKDLLMLNRGEGESMDEVFEILDRQLGESKVGKFYALQTNGTCAHDSIVCWLSSALRAPLFHALLIHMTTRGITSLPPGEEYLKNIGKNTLREQVKVFEAEHEVQTIVDLAWFAATLFTSNVQAMVEYAVGVSHGLETLDEHTKETYRPLIREIVSPFGDEFANSLRS